MSSFTQAAVVPTGRMIEGRPQVEVRGGEGDGFRFYIGSPTSGLAIHVPENFKTDQASWPTPLRRFMVAVGLGWLARWIDACLGLASIVHDRCREDLQFCPEDSDAIYLTAMTADMPTWKGPRLACWLLREIAFAAVRTNTSRTQHNAPVLHASGSESR